MVWFFEREGEKLECEIRQARRGEPFEMVIRDADRQRLERLQDPSELLRRSADLWSQLLTSGWRPKLPPTWPNQAAATPSRGTTFLRGPGPHRAAPPGRT